MRHIISILLQNEAGALARVAGMFAARGYNIESLTVAPTHDPTVSRLTLVTNGSDAVIDQIIKQSRKLIDVVEIADLTRREHLEAELLMLKIAVDPGRAKQVVECVRRHRGQILDETETTRTVQLTGNGAEVNEFLAEISRIAPVLELVRSGTAALESGAAVLAPPA
ncbi:MAG TPA: acetolactate synthase small subunit [Dehalococcoidia bacterium]|nr:acetolactate synthase small subunit [Nevskia sp.]HZU78082.1 acetolactate synthase small subunit [Dehalococcoidia bacterium]